MPAHGHPWRLFVCEHAGKHQQLCLTRTFVLRGKGGVFYAVIGSVSIPTTVTLLDVGLASQYHELTIGHPRIRIPLVGDSNPLLRSGSARGQQFASAATDAVPNQTHQGLVLIQHQHEFSQRPILPRFLCRLTRLWLSWSTSSRGGGLRSIRWCWCRRIHTRAYGICRCTLLGRGCILKRHWFMTTTVV